VFVFEKGKSGRCTCRGPVELADGPYRPREPDIDGGSRWVWVFPTSHEEVRRNLVKMGASSGLDVWVARNDRNKSIGGHAFQDAPRTTAVYSGLLRMSDLITLHPNLMIRLFIVAPDARQSKVMNELVRPTFDTLEPPLRTICGFILYSRLFAEAEIVRR
jgi:hypothetical protein